MDQLPDKYRDVVREMVADGCDVALPMLGNKGQAHKLDQTPAWPRPSRPSAFLALDHVPGWPWPVSPLRAGRRSRRFCMSWGVSVVCAQENRLSFHAILDAGKWVASALKSCHDTQLQGALRAECCWLCINTWTEPDADAQLLPCRIALCEQVIWEQ